MTIPTFMPPLWPSPGAQTKRELKILKAEFGDGYSQPTANGLNHVRRVMDLQWDVLEACDKDEIISFFEARGGTEAFYFALPGQDQMASIDGGPYNGAHAVRRALANGRQPIKWTCEDWSETALAADLYIVNATFRQSFGVAA